LSAVHGGDLQAAALRYGVDPAGLIDFSANISPYGPPVAVSAVLARAARDPRSLAPYPNPSAARLRAALGAMLGTPPDTIVAGHGASALIDAAVRTCPAPAWIVPVPAFSEYRRAVESAGARFVPIPLTESFALDARALTAALQAIPDAGVMLNTPHNPSGTAFERSAVDQVVQRCAELQRPLILDEAFVDYEPERTFLTQAIASPNAIVVRSLTKFYALAGVRVGYAAAHPRTAETLRTILPSWPVGTLDEAIALAAIGDSDYDRLVRTQTRWERAEFCRALEELGLRPHGSGANFLLVELPVALDAMDATLQHLAQAGVVVRDCRSFEGLATRTYVRIAVLDRERNTTLTRALAAVLR
jgi:threonine-phosphate decarboxylase